VRPSRHDRRVILSVAAAVPQLDAIELADGAELVALVKPQFELGLARPPDNPEQLRSALAQARSAIKRAGWRVVADCESPVRGARGAVEFFVHARRERSGGARR
jgi:predicted rRNA methylase YqxC with S4 and FtsJ domains